MFKFKDSNNSFSYVSYFICTVDSASVFIILLVIRYKVNIIAVIKAL